ncbi:MAG TPA: porin family protein [Saprospiraceae bacterium]|nr:porin family protein [Saprospiraceae bacterium]HND89050.1 porin family protein [Saprospiraceae bacterium]HNG90782.1 porin family protein [Saprospiraceae bacterium]
MKKITLSICFLFAFHLVATAQMGKFRYGFQASPTWSWLRSNDKKIEGNGTNWGLKLGVTAEYYLNPEQTFAFIGGLGFGFNQGGTVITNYDRSVNWGDSDLSSAAFDTLGKGAKLHYRLNYVEIPFGFKARFGTGEDSRLRYWLEAPIFTLGFLTKAVGDIRGTNAQNTEDETIRDDVKGLSLAWGLGAGVEYEIASSATVYTGLSFQRQFTDATGNATVFENNDWKTKDPKTYTGVMAVRLGVFF